MSRSIFALERKKLNNYSINICNVSPGRFKEENNFEIFLNNINEETSIDPVIKGKYFSGRGKFYKQWLELYYNNIVRFSESVIIDLSNSKLEKKIKLNYQLAGEIMLDITDDIRGEIILEYPLRLLCKQDCKGLCPRCGKNLNEGDCGCKKQ